MDIVRVENLAKRYDRIGGASYGASSLRETLSSFLKRPFRPGRTALTPAEFWALRNVNFAIPEGTRLGVIGRNGAGKSTLLKLLSRITEPTEGRVELFGRTASLLEIGTGFHPDLSGRENIYMNGALLGMSAREIDQKLDDIIAFAEIEEFLDDPVKHYSSGMYVRLAFSIAAHVDPEILILDEVLAVGDLAFQRKCFGKMQEMGARARTVIFVSHDLNAVASLCDRCLLLEAGRIQFDGNPTTAIQKYYSRDVGVRGDGIAGDEYAVLIAGDTVTLDGEQVASVEIGEPFNVRMRYRLITNSDAPAVPNFHFFTADGTCAFVTQAPNARVMQKGEYTAQVAIPGHFLNEGTYFVGLALTSYFKGHHKIHFYERNLLMINVRDPRDHRSDRYGYAGDVLGVVRPRFEWVIKPSN